MLPGSDDDWDAFELEEDGSDLEEGGIGLGEDVLGLQREAVDEVQGKYFYNNIMTMK